MSLGSLLFSEGRQKGGGSEEEGRWGRETGGRGGRGNCSQDEICEEELKEKRKEGRQPEPKSSKQAWSLQREQRWGGAGGEGGRDREKGKKKNTRGGDEERCFLGSQPTLSVTGVVQLSAKTPFHNKYQIIHFKVKFQETNQKVISQ